MKILKWTGITVFVLALIANLQLALLDYGLGTNSVGYQVFAQTGSSGGSSSGGSSSGDDSSGGGGWLWKTVKTTTPCAYIKTTKIWLCGSVIYYYYVAGCTETTETISFQGVVTGCDDGWSLCIPNECVGAD